MNWKPINKTCFINCLVVKVLPIHRVVCSIINGQYTRRQTIHEINPNQGIQNFALILQAVIFFRSKKSLIKCVIHFRKLIEKVILLNDLWGNYTFITGRLTGMK